MPEKFVVPQFIDNEDKILGPITVRQFLIMLVTVFVIFIEYAILKFVYLIFAGLITAGIGAVFAFVRINGQPFHIFFVNFLQTNVRPPLRVWHKELSDSDLRRLLVEKKQEVVAKHVRKPPPATTRLRDMALTVNTGGVYNAEDDYAE
ncbi:PrgI family protein [Candidatus Uhrbacteria bacterium]|nr:PrgI family protein [Candidatus Uhrbacteria bacterium]